MRRIRQIRSPAIGHGSLQGDIAQIARHRRGEAVRITWIRLSGTAPRPPACKLLLAPATAGCRTRERRRPNGKRQGRLYSARQRRGPQAVRVKGLRFEQGGQGVCDGRSIGTHIRDRDEIDPHMARISWVGSWASSFTTGAIGPRGGPRERDRRIVK